MKVPTDAETTLRGEGLPLDVGDDRGSDEPPTVREVTLPIDLAPNTTWLTTREETDRFKAEHQVKSTPQTFINGERVGGYDDLRQRFGKAAKARCASSGCGFSPRAMVARSSSSMVSVVRHALPTLNPRMR